MPNITVFIDLKMLKKKHAHQTLIQLRRPGLEPGFRRWQRLVITTTLSAHSALYNMQ